MIFKFVSKREAYKLYDSYQIKSGSFDGFKYLFKSYHNKTVNTISNTYLRGNDKNLYIDIVMDDTKKSIYNEFLNHFARPIVSLPDELFQI